MRTPSSRYESQLRICESTTRRTAAALSLTAVIPALSFRELSNQSAVPSTVEQGVFLVRMGKEDGVAVAGGSSGKVIATGKVVPRLKELQEGSQMRAVRGNLVDGAFWSFLHQVIRGISFLSLLMER